LVVKAPSTDWEATLVTKTALQTPLGIVFFDPLTTGDDYWAAWYDFKEMKYGDTGNDRMYAAGGDDWLAGGDDDDDLYGGNGDDNLFGGNDQDVLVGEGGYDQLYGEAGHDLLISGHGNPTNLIATVDDAVFDVGGFMDGGTGNDVLRVDVAFTGRLTIDGGADTDLIDYSQQINAWSGGVPSSLPTNRLDLETLTGETPLGGSLLIARIENVLGSEYRDAFYGDDRSNSLSGLANNDRLEGRGGADVLSGGTGYDIAQYTSSATGVDVDMARATQTLMIARNGIIVSNGDAAGDLLVGIEELRGSNFADILRGKSGGGSQSNEAFYGERGDDTLEGRFGADVLDGGTGFDFASYENSSGAVNVSIPRLGYASARFGHAEGDTLSGIEGLIGSAYADTLIGNDNRNELRGNRGADILSGLGGNDTIRGGAGIDSITGGRGRDVLYGEASADSFKYFSVQDSFGTFAQRDLVKDFTRDVVRATGTIAGDTIDLSAIDANQRAGSTGNQAFNFIGGSAFSAAGQVRVTSSVDASGRAYSLVQAEVTGDNIADLSISVHTTSNALLTVADFLL
jgi:Ca2+-binding RTX toxin-like protein